MVTKNSSDSSGIVPTRPSEVRQIILNEHNAIRKQLQDLEKLSNSKDLAALKQAIGNFQKTFREHLQHEEAILWPVIKTVDSWGPVRLAEMNKEHSEQREMIEALSNLKQENITKIIKELVGNLTDDMASEEKEFLNPELLRDDVVSSGFGG